MADPALETWYGDRGAAAPCYKESIICHKMEAYVGEEKLSGHPDDIGDCTTG